jgi:hypothetical protein
MYASLSTFVPDKVDEVLLACISLAKRKKNSIEAKEGEEGGRDVVDVGFEDVCSWRSGSRLIEGEGQFTETKKRLIDD